MVHELCKVNGQRYGAVERQRDQSSDKWSGLGLVLTPILVTIGVVWWLLRHPVFTVSAALTLLVWRGLGGWGVALLAGMALAGAVVWRQRHRSSFDHLVVARARTAWRGLWVYRRRWHPAMTLAGLTATYEQDQYVPRIKKIRSDRDGDHLLVRMLSGQEPSDFETEANALANTFDALSCRIRFERPGLIWLDFTSADSLAEIVPALNIAASADLKALPVGRREDGAEWRLNLLGTHVLIAGATGSGKGSVIWSIFRAVGPLIRNGTVALWVVDPKGGMELAPGWRCYTRFAYEDPNAMADLLADAEMLVRTRAARLRGVTRQHTPTPDDPLVIVVIDEIASVTNYVLDRDAKRRIAASLSVILTQGRAVGVSVVAAVQDPRKETVPFRDLFPTRIALRLTEASQVDAVLGRGAHKRGAACERILVTQPGVAYVHVDGHREPVRVRTAQATDADIAFLAETYPAPIRAEIASDAELAVAVEEWST